MANMSLSLIPAEQLEVEQLAFLVSRAYADYFFHVWLDKTRFDNMCREEDVDLAHSVVALVDEEPVGLGLLSQRGERGWISGVGVLPLFRRQGVARQMLRWLQEQARALAIRALTLEVLSQNHAGMALYRYLGFVWQRDLLILTLESNISPAAPLPVEISPLAPVALLEHYAAFHDVPSPWQRQFETLLKRVDALQGLGYEEGGRLQGYLLYEEQQHHQAVFDLAVLPGYPRRLAVAQNLLSAMRRLRPRVGGYVINLPVEDALLAAFMRQHYRIWQRQSELVWTVKKFEAAVSEIPPTAVAGL